MYLSHVGIRALISSLVLPVLSLAWAGGGLTRTDRAWKRYHNPEHSYCVSYPSRWQKGEAFEGAGLFVETGVERYSRPVGAIDFEAMPPISDDARAVPVSLAATLEEHLAVLQKFERAERMEILEKREMKLQDYPALFIKNRYYDPQERATWMEEVVFVNRDHKIYRVELQCKADQIQRFEAVFEYLLGTFQFDCRE